MKLKVISKRKVQEPLTVYDLSVEDNHNYQVSNSAIIVHNSGKGFIKNKLLGIEGFVFDVDDLKTLALKTNKFIERVKTELGRDLTSFNLKVPKDVSDLHYIINDYFGIDDKKMKNLYTSILLADPNRKPNIIFDVTLKDLYKLKSITDSVKTLGYQSNAIHIVWAINDVDIASKQNKERSRTVPEEILINTHKGASSTMYDIISMGDSLKNYMDGDIVFVFMNPEVDFEFKTSVFGGGYFEKTNFVYIKKANNPPIKVEDIDKDIINKIIKYTPSKNWS